MKVVVVAPISSVPTLTAAQRATVTPFQARVLQALCQIPAGKVSTYRGLAEYVHCKSYQAVGQALKNNPFAPSVPCHRIVQSDLRLGGYQGRTSGSVQCQRKRERLLQEGVLLRQDNKGEWIVDPSCVYSFPDCTSRKNR